MNSLSTIAAGKQNYRRGIVLGLTMAETILLVLFSLLIAVAAIMEKAPPKTDEGLREQNVQLRQEIVELKNKFSLIAKETDGRIDPTNADWKAIADVNELAESSEDWRELIVFQKSYNAIKNKPTNKQLIELIPILETVVKSGLPERDLKLAISAIEEAGQRAADNKVGINKWPPIINLSEAAGYSFNIGSAELSEEFEALLKSEIADRLLNIVETYDVDLIEVIGHTDEQPISHQISNLDQEIRSVMSSNKSVGTLVPADNAGLGLIRAISISKVLQSDSRLKSITILPYSGAQLIIPGDQIAAGNSTGNSKNRRRIEIRVRRREK